ncbi:MAG: hypothetical protein MUO53_04510 [Maribacter sp.]|nr:hypothetical protein [Maribacter sp.]
MKDLFSIKSFSLVLFLLPIIGIFLFLLLYVLAAHNYPGGSWMVPDQVGFSFLNNYLCDLLDRYAINGELNTARYFARGSLGILCISLGFLWYCLPRLFFGQSLNKTIMWAAGIFALVITFFLTSGTHDVIVRIAGIFGVIAFVTASVELFKTRHFKLFAAGLICLFIFLVNYYIYETGTFLQTLPILQKITFVCFLLWFVSLDLALYKEIRSKRKAMR